MTFRPNQIQKNHIAERTNHRYNRILKARQHGITTLYALELLDDALWTPGITAAITAHERKALERIFEIVRRAFDNLPEQIKPKTNRDNTRELQFTRDFLGRPLDSSIYVDLKTRSGTVNRLHITEAAYIKDYAELVAGSKQAVPKEGRISEESTANGYNVFYDLYTSSKSNQELGEYAYKTYFYGWHENAEYTLAGTIENKTDAEVELQQAHNLTDGQLLWRRWKISELAAEGSSNGLTGEQLFKQEYPTTDLEAFQNASGSVFDQVQIAQITPKNPIQNTNNTELQALIDKRVQVWVEPQKKQNKIDEQTKKIQAVPAHEYVIGVDPSGGESADYAAISVWDCDTLEQVAQWHGKEHPQYVADMAAALGRQYNDAYIGVENNMLSTILYLVDNYDNANIFYDVKLDQLTKKRKKTYGFNTNAKTRPVIIDNFVLLFSQGDLAINSLVTLSEMQTFIITDTGKRQHAPGKHDDALFSDMIALQIMKHRQQKIKAYTSKPKGF